MDSSAFLASAERMLLSFGDNGQRCDSCGARAVIHAAYYSVFHYAAQRLGLVVTGEGYSKHGEVWTVLKARAHESPSLVDAKRNFQSLRDLRQRADYNLSENVLFDQARDAVDLAYEVFDGAGITPKSQ